MRDQILFSLYRVGRVGAWFAFAGFFVGYAAVDEPQQFGWYVGVIIGLAGLQLLTGLLLARSPSRSPGPRSRAGRRGRNDARISSGRTGNPSVMDASDESTGPLEPEKRGETADPGHPQPEAAEVESARVLANEAREALRQAGLHDREIRRLADEYIALDRGENLAEFLAWSKARAPGNDG
jgi:hypothetical protein